MLYIQLQLLTILKVYLTALSRTNPTKLNGSAIEIDVPVELRHKDVFTIGDRHFRWEFPETSPYHLKENKNGQLKETKPDENSEKILTPLVKAPLPEITKRLADLEAEATPGKRKRVSFGQYISPELFDKVSSHKVCYYIFKLTKPI